MTRLLRQVVREGTHAGIRVSICGEMASEKPYTLLLLGLGVRHFSVAPGTVPEVKRVVLDEANPAGIAYVLPRAEDVVRGGTTLTLDARGLGAVAIPLPNVAALSGADLSTQALVVDTPNPATWALTNLITETVIR